MIVGEFFARISQARCYGHLLPFDSTPRFQINASTRHSFLPYFTLFLYLFSGARKPTLLNETLARAIVSTGALTRLRDSTSDCSRIRDASRTTSLSAPRLVASRAEPSRHETPSPADTGCRLPPARTTAPTARRDGTCHVSCLLVGGPSEPYRNDFHEIHVSKQRNEKRFTLTPTFVLKVYLDI